MQEVDLLIVHWNQPSACAATVKAYQAQDIPLRITVIDNHSDPVLLQQLQTELGSTEIVTLEQNYGWGGALNRVLKRDGNPLCFISAHDALPEANCLRRLVDAAEADPRIGIASPQYKEPFVARFSRWRGVVPFSVSPGRPASVQEVDAPHGTLLLVRRKCLAEIGLFDERYFAYGDEHELGMRAHKKGWKVVLVWGAIVENPVTTTASAWRNYLFARNSLLLVGDYAGRGAVLLRASLLLLNTARLRLLGDETSAFARGRLLAVRDYFAGRFGLPHAL